MFSPEDGHVYYDPTIYVAFPESEIKKISVIERNKAIVQKMYENNLIGDLRIAVIRDQKFKEYVEKKGDIYIQEDYPDVAEGDLHVTANKDYFMPLQPTGYEVTGNGQYGYQSYGAITAREEDNLQLKKCY